jgi:hypothetical protein
MDLATMFTEFVALEQRVSDAAAAADPANEMRVYPWRPSRPPELPAIWNWIDDGSYEIVDTARADDIIVITATIGVKPSDMAESMDRLVLLTDQFRTVVDPALRGNQPLGGTARYAKRVITRTAFDTFDEVPVMCMDMLVRIELSKFLA